jgi:hypothetical protein
MRWCCGSLCTRQTRLVGFYSDSSLTQQSAEGHVADSDTLSWFRAIICSFSLILRAERRSNTYQFYSLWFDPIGARTHDLPRPRRAHQPLHLLQYFDDKRRDCDKRPCVAKVVWSYLLWPEELDSGMAVCPWIKICLSK